MTTEPAPRLPLPAIVRRPWSITSRLTLLYAGTTAILLLVASGYLYWGLRESLARTDRALVLGKYNVLRLLLGEQQDKTEALASEIEHEAPANELLKYYLRVLDASGRPLIETPEMAGLLPTAIFPAPTPLSAAAPPVLERENGSGRNYLLLAAEVAAGPGGKDRRILQIALDIAHNNDLLADYRRKLLLVLGTGVLFAALTGVVITRAGLRPLATMTRASRQITANNLSSRLVPEDWPVELRELTQAFDAMLDRLQESFGRLTAFSADIAHALRNPVNNLRGEAEVALSKARSPAEYQQALGSALEEYDRLARMIDGLLFIARTDNPTAQIEHTRVAARGEIAAVQEFYEALAADKAVTVVCAGDAALSGDPMLVRRAVSNLLANALKHTPGGGRVTLAARNRPDGSAEIRVEDTGAGIPAEHLPLVFDRFYQVKGSPGQTSQGAGLGLAIVQSIMRLHRGEVRIESEPGRGTVVILHFPAS